MMKSPTLMFLLPMLVYLLVFRMFPLLHTIFLSFQRWNLVRQRTPVFIGFENFSRLFTDGRFHHGLLISLFFMVVATAIEVLVGTALAVVMDRNFKAKGVTRGILILPMFLNPVAVGTIWYILYEPSIGPLNYFLSLVGIDQVNWLGSTSIALWSILIADVWQWAPFIFLLALSALQGIPQSLIEAAQIDGASEFAILHRIKLPLIRGAIFVAALLRAMDAFRIFPKIYVMTGGGPGQATESASIYILKTAFRFFEMGYAASMTIVMLLMLVIVYGVYLKMIRGKGVEY
jgi:multiple sugar transport system permease protein